MDDVVRFIECGGSRKMAAQFVGVTLRTIKRRMQEDPDFRYRVKQAEGSNYRAQVAKITGSSDWKAAAWFLARKWPEEWSEVKKFAETDPQGRALSQEQRERAIAAIMAKRFS